MNSFPPLKLIAAALLGILSAGCVSTGTLEKVFPVLNDGKYDSEFPYRNASPQLEQISNSIKLVNSIAFYTSYVFNRQSGIRAIEIGKTGLEKNAVEKIFYDRTASGTATIIYNRLGRVVLLTCAHIIAFPDTIVSYFVNSDGSLSPYIQSISIKSRQTNYVNDLPDNGELDILLMDKTRDVALLDRTFSVNKTVGLPVFSYPWGHSEELEWGDFVYIFGFPMNMKVVTKGIVSSPIKDKQTFLIDAAYNKGFSGGIVLAIRDGVPNFEFVGLVKSVPAEYNYTLRPMVKENDLEYNPMIPYKGDFFVDKEQIIRPGLTKVIGIEAVKEFILEHKQTLSSQGYIFEDLFSTPNSLRLELTH